MVLGLNKTDWIINLENAARRANEVYGYDVAASVFKKYGAHSPYSLTSCYYDAAFGELEAMGNDD